MTRRSLDADQRRLVDISQVLGFGVIGRLSIRDGFPCFEPAPVIIREVRLGSEPEPRIRVCDAESDLKKEFERLFVELKILGTGIVDIEVRHGVPFRLVFEHLINGYGSGPNIAIERVEPAIG